MNLTLVLFFHFSKDEDLHNNDKLSAITEFLKKELDSIGPSFEEFSRKKYPTFVF
jgi:hypothetical protein